ncbi:SLBB domain-containing protein [candidate division KSB1 bacterium]|nr:SLBB domain-containing protein [candidate division KSB1 bacterium]
MRFFEKLLCLMLCIALSSYCQERLIKPGDALEIIAPQSEELSRIVVVEPDGTVDFPAMQGLPVDGITLDRFKEVLVAQLSRYMESTPLMMVRFSESYPIKVNVLGQVAIPGLYQIANTATLQGAIGAAGGFVPGAQLSKIKLIRTRNGEQSEHIVNMEQFYLNGDPSVLPLLQDDDTIVVPGNPLATNVKVIGGVEHPGSYEVFFQTTLLDVIYLAGGPTEDANLKKIKIVSLSGQNAREVPIDIKNLLKSKSYRAIPIVVPGDVVYVPKKKVSWRKFFDIVRDLTIFATLYYLMVSSNKMRED